MTAPGALSEARRHLFEKLRRGGLPAASPAFEPELFRPPGPCAPLSPSQEQVWFHAHLAGDAPIYNESITIHKRGPLDAAILERCFNEIVRRHEIWRSAFPATDGKVVQHIETEIQIRLPFVDLSAFPPDQSEEQALRIAAEDAKTPFDLNVAPLFRARLVRIFEDYHRIYLTAHHLVFDGVSLYRVLIAELATLYTAYSSGRPSPLPELAAQYRDYAGWKRHVLDSGGHAGELTYWRETLSGDLPPLEIPTDRPRSPQPAWQGAMETCVVPARLIGPLEDLCRSEGVTRYMLLLAVFQVLLYRYSCQDEVIVGSTINTRTRPEFEPLIGYFLNTVVLRSRLEADLSFREFLGRVKSTVLSAIAHGEVPFDSVVRELAPKRDSAVHPLFQVLFSMRPPFVVSAGGWDISSMEVHNGASSFDLFVEFSERPRALSGRFVYRTDLFDCTTIQRLARNFQVLLENVLLNPDETVSHVSVFADEERRTLLVDWNRTSLNFPAQTIHKQFETRAYQNAAKPAVVFRGQVLTYGELNSRANQLAHYLRTIGAANECYVGLCMERSFEMVIALLGVLKSGAAYVPFDPDLPASRLQAMLRDSHPHCVITQRGLAKYLGDYAGRTIKLDSADEEIRAQPVSNPGVAVAPGDAIYAIYTSGSTGLPKAAINAHEAVANRIHWMQHQYRLGSSDRVLQKTPYSFDVSVWEFFWPLTSGATLVVAEPGGHQDPAYIANLIGIEAITTIHFVPSMLREFLDSPNLARCSSLQRVFSSGEPLPPDLSQKFHARLGAELHNLYGPTEAAVDVTHFDCSQPIFGATVPIGRPISNVRIYILDRHLSPVPISVAGELYIGGIAVARGYLNRPELTAERFIPDPFSENPAARLYKTGDRARFLADGNIEYLGRLDNQVKLRGFRIELGEIEAVLTECDQVTAAAVLMDRDSASGERLVAYIVPNSSKLDLPRLRATVRQRLPEYMIPAVFVPIAALPRTSTGKLDRKSLPTPEPRLDPQQDFASPGDTVEDRLVNLWEQALGVHPISVDDNYFDLGGHSLLALRLFSQINLSFQLKLPLGTLFYAPTVRSMAAIIRDSAVHRPASPVVPIQTTGTKPAVFCVGPVTGEVLLFRDLAIDLGPDQPVYGLQPFDLPNPPSTIESLAASYIDELRRCGHDRPFCLVGYSFGGAVALDMARQLTEDGIDPPIVVMIDSSNLTGCKIGESWKDRVRRYKYHLNRIARGAGGVYHLADRLRSLCYRTIHRVSTALAMATPGIAGETARLQLVAGENYRPRPYSGTVYLLKAESRPEFFDKPDLGWGEVIKDLRIENVPGDHLTVRSGANLKILAEKLARFLHDG